MADIYTTLHPEGNKNDNLYPNIKKENIPNFSITMNKLSKDIVSNMGSLKPAGTNTSTNILSFTSNKGIYVATDNGHWYYWNGTQYVDGGVYQASEDSNSVIELQQEIISIRNGLKNGIEKKYFVFEQGGIDTTNGNLTQSDARIRTITKTDFNTNIKILIEQGYSLYVYKYSKVNGAYVSASGWYENNIELNTDYDYKFVIKNNDNSNILPNNYLIWYNYNLEIASEYEYGLLGVSNVNSKNHLYEIESIENYSFSNRGWGIDFDLQIKDYGLDNIVIWGYLVLGTNYIPIKQVSITNSDIENYKKYHFSYIGNITLSNEKIKLLIGYRNSNSTKSIMFLSSISGYIATSKLNVDNLVLTGKEYNIDTNLALYEKSEILNSVVLKKDFIDLTIKLLDSNYKNFSGKIFNCLGDSITAGVNTTKIWHNYLAEDLGIIDNNYGINGSTIADYVGIIDHSVAMCNRFGNMDQNSDYVIIFGGTNDFNRDVPIGKFYTLNGSTREYSIDKTTFKGALNVLLLGVKSFFPDKKIILMTPIHRGKLNGEQPNNLEQNSIGLYFDEYISAIREASSIHSIQLIDLYSSVGLDPLISEQANLYFHENDTIHPNALGHKKIAEIVEKELS